MLHFCIARCFLLVHFNSAIRCARILHRQQKLCVRRRYIGLVKLIQNGFTVTIARIEGVRFYPGMTVSQEICDLAKVTKAEPEAK